MEWQKKATSFDGIAAYGWTFTFLVDDSGSTSMSGMVVTPDYFRVTGLQPLMGRAFTTDDTTPPTTVIILAYDCWKRLFNGDPNIIGKQVRMSRRESPPTVVGVMPPRVRFLPSPLASQEPNYNVNATVDFWVPSAPNPQRLKQSRWDIVARLKPGVAVERAQAELSMLNAAVANGDTDVEAFSPRLQPMMSEMSKDGAACCCRSSAPPHSFC